MQVDATTFDRIFDYVAPSGGVCPDGYTGVTHSYGAECLKLKTGMEMLAAAFETRRQVTAGTLQQPGGQGYPVLSKLLLKCGFCLAAANN